MPSFLACFDLFQTPRGRFALDLEFSAITGTTPVVFVFLTIASAVTSFLGLIGGTAGGVMMLAIMAMFFPPAQLIPMHTLVQLGTGSTRALMLYQHVLYPVLLPFFVGSAIGAGLGARIFISLPSTLLLGFLGVFIATIAWLPDLGRLGTKTGRFAAVGFASTFLGVFVSATGTVVAPFVAAASPDRRNHAATLAATMTIVHVMKLVAFGLVGVAIGQYALLIAAMIVAGVIGNYAGARALNSMREAWFRIGFKLLMTALACRLIWMAGRQSGWW